MSKRSAFLAFTIGLGLLLASLAAFAVSEEDDAGDATAIEESMRSAGTSQNVSSTIPPDTAGDVSQSPPEGRLGEDPMHGVVEVPENDEAGLDDRGYEPPNLVIEPGPAPVALRIERLGVDAAVGAYGVNPRTGEMEVPENVTDVGWYRFGPSPGEAGSSVLAAHVDLAGQGPGVFFDLRSVDPGALIVVEMDDASERFFRVHARKTYHKEELPLDVIFAKEGPPILTLITCGGGFNRSVGSYDSNVVVYAVPVDGPDDPGDLAR